MLRNIVVLAIFLIPSIATAQSLCTERVVQDCGMSGINCGLVVVCD